MERTTTRQQQAQATKQAIFDHALELFSERPYEEISVKDICQAAGVSVGAFYHHFKSKDNLLDEGYRMFDERLGILWGSRETASCVDDIHFLVAFQIASLENMGAFAAAQYFKNQLSVDHSYMLDENRVLNRLLVESIATGVVEGILAGEPRIIAEEILSVTRGTIYDWCLHGSSYDLSDRACHFIDMLLEHYRA